MITDHHCNNKFSLLPRYGCPCNWRLFIFYWTLLVCLWSQYIAVANSSQQIAVVSLHTINSHQAQCWLSEDKFEHYHNRIQPYQWNCKQRLMFYQTSYTTV